MRFLRANLFRADYRAQIEAAGVALGEAPDLVDVRCPRCEALYVADLAADEEPWDLEALEWEAQIRLSEECPDHPVRFSVGD